MNLKKNDKIILIVGVIILIIAGAGIALYTVEDTDDSDIAEDMEYLFSYTWSERTGEKVLGSVDDLYAAKKSPYEDTHSVSSPSNSVLTSVEIDLEWEDDITYGLLIQRGLDTLSADISRNGDSMTRDSVGSGNESFFFSINKRQPADSVLARSLEDAEDGIEDLISGMNTASFDVTVTVIPGEKIFHIFHLLKVLRDKGNDFSLTASYTYYTFELDESGMDTNDDADDDNKESGDNSFSHNVGEFYINLGYGRGMI